MGLFIFNLIASIHVCAWRKSKFCYLSSRCNVWKVAWPDCRLLDEGDVLEWNVIPNISGNTMSKV